MTPSTFQHINSRYFNTGIVHGYDKVLSAFNPDLPFAWNAGYIKKCFNEQFSSMATVTSDAEKYSIEKYPGADAITLEISDYLNHHLKNDLAAAIVHGSIATEEKINYSDFDGLLIIRNEVYENNNRIKKVAKHISKTYSLMIKGDPLQHHGWFILTEADLLHWPADYFPPVILKYSKSLLQDPLLIQLNAVINIEQVRVNLKRTANSIQRKLEGSKIPGNAYLLKNLLSEFMLLPTLFLHAQSGTGIYKKNSFTEARKVVPENMWKAMDKVSAIRAAWDLNKGISIRNAPVLVTPALKKQQIAESATIPASLLNEFDTKLINEMSQLSTYFLKAIK